jgi:hypothetical protein
VGELAKTLFLALSIRTMDSQLRRTIDDLNH